MSTRSSLLIIDQPLTAEECQFIAEQRSHSGCIAQINAAGLRTVSRNDKPYLSIESQATPALVRKLLVETLSPLSDRQYRQGRYATACGCSALGLRVGLSVLGEHHPDTIAAAINLAACLEALGRAPEALPYLERALEGCHRTLGARHPHTVLCTNNLAASLTKLGRDREALPHYERAVHSSERLLGKSHPHSIVAINNLVHCLKSLDRSQEAVKVGGEALRRSQGVLGRDHPYTLALANAVALCQMQASKDASTALPSLRQSMKGRERAVGVDHPDTLRSVGNLAGCLMSLQRYREARRYYERAVAGCERVLGREHVDTLDSIGELAQCLDCMGKHDSALDYHLQVAHSLSHFPQPTETWIGLAVQTARAIPWHAQRGRLQNWWQPISRVAAALLQATDLQSPEQSASSRAQVKEFFALYLNACIKLHRPDLIPEVLAAQHGRGLAALAWEKLEAQGDDSGPSSALGRLRATRVELRRLAIGLQTQDVLPTPRDRAAWSQFTARQRAQMEEYKSKLDSYRAQCSAIRASDEPHAIATRSSISLSDLQEHLLSREAIALLFEYESSGSDAEVTRLALFVTRNSAMLVPLVDSALSHAVNLSAQWGRIQNARFDRRRSSNLTDGVESPFGVDASEQVPSTVRAVLSGLLLNGLWAPLEACLKDVDRVHVVCTGGFHILPVDVGAPRDLIVHCYPGIVYYNQLRTLRSNEDASVVLAPSATTALGISVHAAEGHPGLTPIPFVHAEQAIARALWPGNLQVEPHLHAEGSQASVLHLAGHGYVDPKDPARTSIVLSNQALDFQSVLKSLERPAVVVLSACTAGVTAHDCEGEPLGLPGAYILKGARCVIASLQPVADFYMPLFMALFYESWTAGYVPSVALADAKHRFSSGEWHANTEALVRTTYHPIITQQLTATVQADSDSRAKLFDLLKFTHAWPFPQPYRAIDWSRDSRTLDSLRLELAAAAGCERMANAILDCLVAERDRISREHVDSICIWLTAYGS